MPIFLVIFIFPIFEELFFRAYLLTFLEQKTKYSNLIQALIFSILHFNNIQKIYTFFFALYLGYVAKKENIYLCIILHILFNLIGIYFFKIMPLYYTRFTSIILTSF
ncbi:CPBP family intramembrane glutamic endopeptidase [Sneathia sanguinegens]